MMYQLPVGKGINVRIDYVDAAGNPAEVDTIDWSTSDDTIIAVEVNQSDNHLCLIKSVDDGQAQVVATADVDLGEGVENLITTMDVQVIPGKAVGGTITPVGDPVDLP
jgi:hypothetical protein